MNTRLFLVSRTGDGSSETPFMPDVPDSANWKGYTVGTKFLVASPDDLTASGIELTLKTAIIAACKLYGVTLDMVDCTPDGSPGPTTVLDAVKQLATLAAHAPVALAYRAVTAVKSVFA